ncbi:cell wall hydrolase [Orenia marismortui]|uniref:cell wall hydrolase n=1 Tax=Orenia marismortui TaxID=46469 RepID=UPI0010651D5A|nr:cell wall hydrolase [Orenia marismortui]
MNQKFINPIKIFLPPLPEQKKIADILSVYHAARVAWWGEDPTRGAIYFYNHPAAKYQWCFKTREVVVQIGNHVFAK